MAESEKSKLLGVSSVNTTENITAYGAVLPPSRANIKERTTKIDTMEQEMKQLENEKINEGFRILNTKLDITNLSEIDTAKRTFLCDIEVTLNWAMTEQQQNKVLKLHDEDPDKLNAYLSEMEAPELICANGRDIDPEYVTTPKVKISVMRDDEDRYQFQCVQWLRGEWAMGQDKEELNDFPFDYQPLEIYIITKTADRDRFRLYVDRANAFKQPNIIVRPAQSQEFDCYMAEFVTSFNVNPTSQTYDGFLTISIRAKRKWRYYFNQVAVFVFLLSCMVLPAYSIDVSDVADRLSHFVTVALAQTALLYFVGGSLPKLTYFSILDEYLIWCFIFTLGCAVQTAIVSLISDSEQEQVDRYCFYAAIGVFVCINGFYTMNACYTSIRNYKRRHNTEYVQTDQKDGFVEAEYDKDEEYWNGACVYHRHNWNQRKEIYRHWTNKNTFVHEKIYILDQVVILFGKGKFDADSFFAYYQE